VTSKLTHYYPSPLFGPATTFSALQGTRSARPKSVTKHSSSAPLRAAPVVA
jgi:hypothetical protein